MRRMSFGSRWMKWMEFCDFISSMFVLINGSPTLDFQARRGLRQRGTIYPFLFLMALEGLAGLVHSAI